MSFQRTKLATAMLYAVGAIGLAAAGAHAQQVEKIEKIEVTGSRIPQPNIESTSPISTVSSQDIKMSGLTTTEDLLNNLPQAFADYGGNLANGATGTATVNLRNLGAARTLVLINGRRLPAGSPLFYPTDLNQIPAQLIERIEIFTGGASAVYGSDAVAGVVNFKMNDHFEGVQVDINHQFYNHDQHNDTLKNLVNGRAATNPSQFHIPGDVGSDGEIDDYALTLGSNFGGGKGNATFFLSYHKTQAVEQSRRDFSSCATGSNKNGLTCAGSSTSFPGRFIDLNNANTPSFTLASGGGVRRFSAATDQFNFAPFNFYQRPDERYSFSSFIHYDITPEVRVYSEFGFHDDHTIAQIAPSGSFLDEFMISANNPLLTPAWKSVLTPGSNGNFDLLIGRRNVEGGPRQDDLRHTSYRGVVGVKGTVAKFWDYDVYLQRGKVLYQEEYKNDLSRARTARALDVVADPATGKPVCASTLNGTDANCVPWNIFSLGGVTPAATSYLQTPGFEKGSTQQDIYGATLTADLGDYGVKLPTAKHGVGISFGAERRTEKLDFDTDIEFQTFDLAGQGGPIKPLSGKYTVKEAFGEIRVPIVEGRPFMELISVNGSYRYSDYSTGKTTDSYGVGAEWAPVKAARLRGSYQQAVRAANVIELFQAQGFNLFNMTGDPCGQQVDGSGPTATLAQCQRTGLNPAQYGSALLSNPAGQFNFLQGGNPDLNPEKSKSYTVGFVVTPLRNFSASVDYFHIKVNDVIDIIQPPLALQQCLNTGQFCNLIHRDAQGTLWLPNGGFVTGTNLNLGSRKTEGIDVAANYSQSLGRWGSLGFNFLGTYLQNFITQPLPGGGDFDCAGLFGSTCGTPLPRWRHSLRTNWSSPWNVDVSLTWRHFNKVSIDASSDNSQLSGPFNPVNAELGERDYLDLAASWAVTKQITLRGGVDNVFDRDPPIISSAVAGPPFGNGNTYPQVYDTLGRRVFANLTLKF